MAKIVATILSYAMGVESSAILLSWIMSPMTRPCPLEELIAITSYVGDEYTDTGRYVEAHTLPLIRAHGFGTCRSRDMVISKLKVLSSVLDCLPRLHSERAENERPSFPWKTERGQEARALLEN